MAGKRVDLSTLADDDVHPARVPRFASTAGSSARIVDVAPNPLNTRQVMGDLAALGQSILTTGQIQPCAVVSRAAFLAIFPEYEDAVRRCTYVAVTGARRRAAKELVGLPTLDITVKEEFAESRARFLAATAGENIDRQDYDPLEEAAAVSLLVKELGSGKAAAEQLNRTPPWVTQRMNLLKLTDDLQAKVRSGELPVRVAREWGKKTPDEQHEEWQAWQAERAAATAAKSSELTAVNSGDPDEAKPAAVTPKPRDGKQDPTATAVRKLGATPPEIATALRTHLPSDEIKELAQLLLA